METNLSTLARQAHRNGTLGDFLSGLEAKQRELDRFFDRYLGHKSVVSAMDKFQLDRPEWTLYKKKLNEYQEVKNAITLANFLQSKST